ncbi:MAG: hypothetical protein ACKJSK_14325 [Roseibacillus sp.]
MYTGELQFRLESEVGVSDEDTLNGEQRSGGVLVMVDEARYYQFEVVKTEKATAQQENVTFPSLCALRSVVRRNTESLPGCMEKWATRATGACDGRADRSASSGS